MAIGFPAAYTTEIERLGSIDSAKESAIYILNLFGWNPEIKGQYFITAQVPLSGMSWGEIITISFELSGVVRVQSRGKYPFQVFDLGRNRANVNNFISLFNAKDIRNAKLPSPDPIHHDLTGRSPVERALNNADVDYEEAIEFVKTSDVKIPINIHNVQK